jgi:hypothetical protein
MRDILDKVPKKELVVKRGLQKIYSAKTFIECSAYMISQTRSKGSKSGE